MTGPVRVLPPASVNIIKQPDSVLRSAFPRCPGIVYNHIVYRIGVFIFRTPVSKVPSYKITKMSAFVNGTLDLHLLTQQSSVL